MQKNVNLKVSIIILNFNGKKDTIECLKSLSSIKYKNLEIIVVDNGSSDNSAFEIQKYFNNIKIIQNNIE